MDVLHERLLEFRKDSDNNTRTASARCTYLDYNYDVSISIICGTYLIFGMVYSLFGYRCFRAIMFLTGFMFSSVVVFLICQEEERLPFLGKVAISLSAGLLYGLICMLVYHVGLFMTGLHTGFLLGVITLVLYSLFGKISSGWISFGMLFGFSLLGAVMNLVFQRSLTVIGTALFGGFILVASIDYFVEKFLMMLWIWDRVRLTNGEMPCWFSWLILAIWPFLTITGSFTQFCWTAGEAHTMKYAYTRASRRRLVERRLAESDAAARQRLDKSRRYRYLYQVRTAHGDVISQNCIDNVQQKLLREDKTYTVQSNSTHQSTLPLPPPDLDAY
ncbi:transmembrane protein 198-like [Artemia franciscana]|uniref:transmembrane protein 198-like n=1 Tax=Artemia franciscana TaxID=6661 RepID=UPI0032DBC2C5